MQAKAHPIGAGGNNGAVDNIYSLSLQAFGIARIFSNAYFSRTHPGAFQSAEWARFAWSVCQRSCIGVLLINSGLPLTAGPILSPPPGLQIKRNFYSRRATHTSFYIIITANSSRVEAFFRHYHGSEAKAHQRGM